jgi:xylulose-5-phosphate/fructose-6-phosphate phosphoketolase
MACSGDVPTLETLAAVGLLREKIPDLRIRVVNVVDLMALQPQSEHPHGLPDEQYDHIFPSATPVVFAFHGYPWLIHRLTYRRHNHDNLHVRGYKEEGTTTTPFDMCVLNNIDRFQLTLDAIKRVPRLKSKVNETEQWYSEAIQRHRLYVTENGDDLPEIRNWRWPQS